MPPTEVSSGLGGISLQALLLGERRGVHGNQELPSLRIEISQGHRVTGPGMGGELLRRLFQLARSFEEEAW